MDTVYYPDVTQPTRIRYFGDSIGSNDLVNKGYVDDLIISSSDSLVHGGTIAAGAEGSISNTGNLSIQKSSLGEGGELVTLRS